MPDSAPDPFQDCLSVLTGGRDPRVWSLIVTIFGDLAQQPGAAIGGAVLSRITGLAGIRPEAMRVALHRLRRDGWIESERIGRASRHRLSAEGRRQSARVTPRIYAERIEAPPVWHVLVANGGEAARGALEAALATGGYLGVAGNVALAPGPPPETRADLLAFEATALRVPSWLQEAVCPPSLNAAYKGLRSRLSAFEARLGSAGDLSPFQVAAARTLVVHDWRRLLLRHPDLPAEFFPPDWPGSECRALVFRLLRRLPRPRPAALRRAAAKPA